MPRRPNFQRQYKRQARKQAKRITRYRPRQADPTPDHIARMTAAIRAGWSEKEELDRRQTGHRIPATFDPISDDVFAA